MKRAAVRVSDDLPPALEPQRRLAEQVLGMPVRVRGVRTQDGLFRGRAVRRLRVSGRRRGYVLVEYQVAQAGYFWHVPVIEEILERLTAGESDVYLPQAEPPS